MTSEPSQHGWQPTDRYEPTDEAPNSRGYGLFDAPAAPDEFPSFTPFSGSGRDSDAFPPDSDPAPASAFGGFPSDDLPAPSEWASQVSEHYVPAPAVMPIPGVRHDMETSPASWATTSDSFDPDPYPVPAADLDRDEPSGNAASSWAAFAAGDRSKGSSTSGAAWSDASAPAWEDHPLNESRRDEPSWGESSFAAAAAEQEAAKPVSPVVGSARVAAAAPLPSRVEPQEAAPSATPKPAGRVYGSATVAQPEPNEPSYAPPPPPMPAPAASGPVRASARASVSVAKPTPGEALPQTTRSSTVYGSAAAAPAQAPGGAPPPMGAAGLAAPHASAGLAAPHAAAPHAAGLAPGAAGVAAPGQAGLRPGRQHAFGDLLGPAGTEAPPAPPHAAPIPAQRGPAPAGQGMPGGPGMPGHAGPGQGMPGHGGPGQGGQGHSGQGGQGHGGPGQTGPGQAPYGAPPPPGGAPAPRASASVPSAGPASQTAFDQFKPATTDAPQQAEQPKPERKGRIIAGVLVGCVALLALAFGGLFLVDKIFNGPSFVVGDCVKQNDNVAVRAECTETGAFQVKAAVSTPAECQDQSQPHVQQKNQILCLAPVAATSNTGATPTPTASPNQ